MRRGLSFRWDGETDVPNSTAAQVNVAGAFTGGGATIGQQRLKELNIEADDDAILTTKHHTMKFGTQFMLYDEHQQLTTNFNGTYTFGGGTAPVLDANNQPVAGETETITGVEQYQRALLGLAGGSPTAYSNVAGTPTVDFNAGARMRCTSRMTGRSGMAFMWRMACGTTWRTIRRF